MTTPARRRDWPFCEGNICPSTSQCGYGRNGCDDAWRNYQRALAAAFQEANPQVNLTGYLDIHYGTHALLYDVHGVTVYISQPYSHVQVSEREWASKGLGVKSGGTERSWYFPRSSQLFVLAPLATLDTFRLDYPLPDARLQPVRCIEWHQS